jgi:3-keto-5-aminohexanoate cleavage enzyme
MVRSLPPDVHWAATGIGKFQLKINFAAVLMGGHVRVGLKDNLYYDEEAGRLATNAQLIERVASFAKQIGREVATPKEAREMLAITM